MSKDPSTRILSGPLVPELLRFGLPLALGMALQNTFNLVDAYLIAQLSPAEVGAAIGAIGICDQLAALGTILSYGITVATGTLLSNQKGAGEEDSLRRVAWQSVLLVVGLGVLFGLVGAVFAPVIVRDLVGAKGAVATEATRYLRVVVGGSISIFLLLHLTNLQRALGSAKTPVALLVLGNVLNVALAAVLMYGPGPAPSFLGWATSVASALHIPRLGLLGAAWATILARGLVLLPNVVVLARRFQIVRPPRGERGPNPKVMRRILSLAWPMSAQLFVRIGGMLLVVSLVARYFTTPEDQTASTAMGLVFRVDTIALFIAMGWGSAAQTFVGLNLGAEKEERAIVSGWLTAAFDTLTNLILVTLLMRHAHPILRAFGNEPAALSLAVRYLEIVAPSYLTLGFAVVLGNAMAGAGATRTTLLLDLFIILGVQLPVSLVVLESFHGGIEALFRCVAATNYTGALVYAAAYARGRWRGAQARIGMADPAPRLT